MSALASLRRIAPWLIVAAGAALRLATWPHLSFAGDEAWTLRWIQQPVRVLMTGFDVGLSMHLYLLLLKGWSMLAGISEFALKSPSLLCGIATLPVLYVIGKRWAGPSAALAAVLLAAFSPPLIESSRVARVYAALVLYTPLLLAAFLHAMRSNRRGPWRLLGVANAVGIMFSGNASYMMFVQGAVVLIEAWRDTARRRELLVGFTVSSLVAIAVGLAFYAASLPVAFHLMARWSGGSAPRLYTAAGAWLALHPALPALLALLVVVGTVVAWRMRTVESRLLIAWVWVPPLIFLIAGSRHPPGSLARFLLPTLPAHFLLVGLAFASAARRWSPSRPAAASLAVAIVLALAGLASSRLARDAIFKEPLATRPAIARIRALAGANDVATARTDGQAWILRGRVPCPVEEWPALAENAKRETFARLLAIVPGDVATPDAWRDDFTVETAGGSFFRKDVLLVVSRPLATADDRLRAVRSWLEGLIEISRRERQAPPPRLLAEQALLTLGLSHVAEQRGDAAESERLRLQADALMKQAVQGQRSAR
jgi:hypothetical protein